MKVEVHAEESDYAQEWPCPDSNRSAVDEYRGGSEYASHDAYAGAGSGEPALDVSAYLTVSKAVQDAEEDIGDPHKQRPRPFGHCCNTQGQSVRGGHG